jgi:hypothetical protein
MARPRMIIEIDYDSDTPLQDAIEEFLRDWKRDPQNDGNSPTYEQIGKALDKHKANIQRSVVAMARSGRIKINPNGKMCLPDGKYILPE